MKSENKNKYLDQDISITTISKIDGRFVHNSYVPEKHLIVVTQYVHKYLKKKMLF